MAKKRETLPNFNPQEMAFNVEAVRGFLFTAGVEVFEGMQQQNVDHASAIVMTGAVEFAAQLWMQTALASGITPKQARETAEKEFRTFLRKHSQPREQKTAVES